MASDAKNASDAAFAFTMAKEGIFHLFFAYFPTFFFLFSNFFADIHDLYMQGDAAMPLLHRWSAASHI